MAERRADAKVVNLDQFYFNQAYFTGNDDKTLLFLNVLELRAWINNYFDVGVSIADDFTPNGRCDNHETRDDADEIDGVHWIFKDKSGKVWDSVELKHQKERGDVLCSVYSLHYEYVMKTGIRSRLRKNNSVLDRFHNWAVLYDTLVDLMEDVGFVAHVEQFPPWRAWGNWVESEGMRERAKANRDYCERRLESLKSRKRRRCTR